jgi:hypothetical protein
MAGWQRADVAASLATSPREVLVSQRMSVEPLFCFEHFDRLDRSLEMSSVR